MPILQ